MAYTFEFSKKINPVKNEKNSFIFKTSPNTTNATIDDFVNNGWVAIRTQRPRFDGDDKLTIRLDGEGVHVFNSLKISGRGVVLIEYWDLESYTTKSADNVTWTQLTYVKNYWLTYYYNSNLYNIIKDVYFFLKRGPMVLPISKTQKDFYLTNIWDDLDVKNKFTPIFDFNHKYPENVAASFYAWWQKTGNNSYVLNTTNSIAESHYYVILKVPFVANSRASNSLVLASVPSRRAASFWQTQENVISLFYSPFSLNIETTGTTGTPFGMFSYDKQELGLAFDDSFFDIVSNTTIKLNNKSLLVGCVLSPYELSFKNKINVNFPMGDSGAVADRLDVKALLDDAVTINTGLVLGAPVTTNIDENNPLIPVLSAGNFRFSSSQNDVILNTKQLVDFRDKMNSITKKFDDFVRTDGSNITFYNNAQDWEKAGEFEIFPHSNIPIMTSDYLSNKQIYDQQKRLNDSQTITSAILSAVGGLASIFTGGLGVGVGVGLAGAGASSFFNLQRSDLGIYQKQIQINDLQKTESIKYDGALRVIYQGPVEVQKINRFYFTNGVVKNARGRVISTTYAPVTLANDDDNRRKFDAMFSRTDILMYVPLNAQNWLWQKLTSGVILWTRETTTIKFGDYSNYEF